MQNQGCLAISNSGEIAFIIQRTIQHSQRPLTHPNNSRLDHELEAGNAGRQQSAVGFMVGVWWGVKPGAADVWDMTGRADGELLLH